MAAGDKCTHIKFIVSGKVCVDIPFSHLRVSLSQSLTSPHVLAAEYLFGRDTAYPYTAIADGPCGILQLKKSDYIKMVNFDKVFLFNILNYLSSSSQRVTALSTGIRDGSVAERLVNVIDALAMTGAENIVLRYKQKDLCALLGTQRTTLIATLDRLSDAGAIDYDSSHMEVLDLEQFKMSAR